MSDPESYFDMVEEEKAWRLPQPSLIDRLRRSKFSRKVRAFTTVKQIIAWLHEADNPPRWGYIWGDGPPPDLGPYHKFKVQLDCLRAVRR